MDKPTSKVSEVRVTGPLAPFVEGLTANLRDTGYTPLTTVNVLRVVAHLSRWLDVNQLAAADLTEQQVERYFRARRALGYKASLTPASVAPLLDVVRETGVFDSPERSTSLSATDVLLAAFGRFLCDERALATPTVAAYVDRARRFLDRYEGCAVFDLTADQVTSAVLAEASAVSVGSAQYYVSALRSFLRFCFIRGLVKAELSAAALAVTGRRRSPLPRGIDRGDATALLHSCDRRRPAGRRDYALLLTLLRFGLRASEVVPMLAERAEGRPPRDARTDRRVLPLGGGRRRSPHARRRWLGCGAADGDAAAPRGATISGARTPAVLDALARRRDLSW